MEREAKKLRELQAAADQASASGDETGSLQTDGEDRTAADGRSVYVGNVSFNTDSN